MAIFNLPPPSNPDVNSFVWKDWFYKFTAYLANLVIGIAQGGTGLTSIGTPNQVLGVNPSGTALEYKSIVAGSGINITTAAGNVTINANMAMALDGADGEDGMIGPMGPRGLDGVGAGSVTISDTVPGAPTVGNLWWSSISGILYIYYNDGTSTQWVQVIPSGLTSSIPTGGNGVIGMPGIDGEDGEIQFGIPGAQGPMGPPGATGVTQNITTFMFLDSDSPDEPIPIRGATGIQGVIGPTGAQGLIGPAVYLEAESIEGEQGNPGVPGLQGIQGIQGITGPVGPQGIIGIGLDGESGEDGVGIPGPQGIQGVQGPPGSGGSGSGSMGMPGFDGEDADYPIVIPGPRGPQGAPGGGGSGGNGTAILDFGTKGGKGTNTATIAVTGLTTISATSVPRAFIMSNDTTGTSTANDHRYADLYLELTCGTPTAGVGFTIYGTSLQKLAGTFQVRYVWTD